jgi:hypothetical protein
MLVAATEPAAFRTLAAAHVDLIPVDARGRSGKPRPLETARLDEKTFAAQVKPLVPHEPSPMDGEGEELSCDEAARTCVFKDAVGRSTTYVFTPAPDEPHLREIRFPGRK